MEIQAALLRALPVRRDAGVDVRLVYDLRDQLRALADGARVWRWEFGARYGVLAAVDDEQTDEDPDMLHGEAQHEDGGQDEENDALAHGGGRCCFSFFAVFSSGARSGRGARGFAAGSRIAVEIEADGRQTVLEVLVATRGPGDGLGGERRRSMKESSACWVKAVHRPRSRLGRAKERTGNLETR